MNDEQQPTPAIARPAQRPGLRWSDTRGAIAAALAAARPNFGAVSKDRKGQVGAQAYRYSTLESVLGAVADPLAAQGIAIVQSVDTCEGWIVVETELVHASGEWVASTCVAPERVEASKALSTVQEAGKMMTYLRRYALTSITGVTTEEDTDGAKGAPKLVAKRETPEERSERQAKHHPSWEADRARFCAALREQGVTLEDLAAWRDTRGKPRPSAMDNAGRAEVFTAAVVRGSKGREVFDEWLAERKAIAGEGA